MHLRSGAPTRAALRRFMLLLVSLALAKKPADDCPTRAEFEALQARVVQLEQAAGPPTAAEELAASTLMATVQESLTAGDSATAKATLEQLLREYPTTRAGKAAGRMQPELAIIGVAAAPLAVESWFQGRADYHDAPATLLVFFEEWCPHCRNSMPELAGRAAELKEKGVQVIALTKVTKSATDTKVMEFLSANAIPFAVAKEDGAMSTGFAVTGIPAAALVQGGVVIWRGHPSRLEPAMLDRVLASAR